MASRSIVDKILGTLIDLKEDGSYRMDMRYFQDPRRACG